MRNSQGGKIVPGNLLLWCIGEETLKSMGRRMIVKVVDVIEPVIEGNSAPPTLVLSFSMPIDTSSLRPGTEVRLDDFFGLTNPNEEKALDNLLKN